MSMIYQVSEFYDPVGIKKISSKCPDCSNTDCLELNFYQKSIETPFVTNVTNKVTGVLFCNYTKTEINPVIWTDEIEKYFINEKQNLKLAPKKFKFTKGFIIIMVLVVLLFVGGIGYSVYENNQYQENSKGIENVGEGDKVKAMITSVNGKQGASVTTWFLVKKIKADSIWLQPHSSFKKEYDSEFDLSDTKFNAKTVKLSLTYFKLKILYGFDPSNQEVAGAIFEILKPE